MKEIKEGEISGYKVKQEMKSRKKPHWLKIINKRLRNDTNMCYHSLTQKFFSIFDHGYCEGDTLIGEPYDVSMKDLELFIKFCKENNLTFAVLGGAKHHPDCIRIIVHPIKKVAES